MLGGVQVQLISDTIEEFLYHLDERPALQNAL